MRYIQKGLDDERPPERSSRGPFVQNRDVLHSGERESNVCGGTVARRTNYGFEKKQRELRKQKKKQEKADRRAREEEAAKLAADGGEAEDETPPESGPPDND